MNLQNDPSRWVLAKFGIGQPVLRSEDPKLLRGEGRFTEPTADAQRGRGELVFMPLNSHCAEEGAMKARGPLPRRELLE